MRYKNRQHAGRALARELTGIVQAPSLVAGISRGGLFVARPIAQALGAPLTVVHVRKLVSPWAPEVAFGAVDEDGGRVVDRAAVLGLELSEHDIERTIARARWELTERPRAYIAPPLTTYLPGSWLVLVDDGMTTGLTMMAAINHARRRAADKIVVAVPCASRDAADAVGALVERFVCPIVERNFTSVETFYKDFAAVGDDEASRELTRHHSYLIETTASMRRLQPMPPGLGAASPRPWTTPGASNVRPHRGA